MGSSFNPQFTQYSDPSRYNRYIQLEQFTANYIAALNDNKTEIGRLINPNGTIIIPVVVHVLHRGEAIGVGNNISDAQIQSQIDVLNEDFRRLNTDRVNTPAAFASVAAEPNIEFRLTCVDPNGNPTNGIHRVFTTVNTFTVTDNPDGSINEQATRIKFTSQRGTDAWATDRYLNIWVCNIIPNGDGSQTVGYAQFPFDYITSSDTDGVVILNWAFGRVGTAFFPVDRGRTATHEVGHWLNLFHIWGDAPCGDDHCDDTPQQFAANQSNCPGFPHPSNCPNNGANGDMFMNYMDYTVDGCKNIYTQDQTNRMRAVFASGGPRESFINNYFRINTPVAPICNTGTVSVLNPNCLPVTWTIVSGPATIISGQSTNSLTIQQTGNGTAVLRATAGSYFDEINIQIGLKLPYYDIYAPNGTCAGDFFEAIAVSNNGSGATYNWYINTQLQGVSIYKLRSSFPTDGTYIGVTVSKVGCGTSEEYYRYWDCTGSFILSSNPTSSDVSVETKTGRGFSTIRVLDKMGSVKAEYEYSKNTKKATISVSNLPTDIYTIQVWDGQKWLSKQLIKQ